MKDNTEILDCRDLTDVTRGETFETRVRLKRGNCFVKVSRGELQRTSSDGSSHLFDSYVEQGFDREHDRAHAVMIPLVGVFSSIISSRFSLFTGWIKGGSKQNFVVPDSEFDPIEGAEKCDDPACQKHRKHYFVDYTPDRTPEMDELYQALLGNKIEIEFQRESR